MRPDGSDLHLAVPEGAWATWSGDSKWLYYADSSPVRDTGSFRLMKSTVEGGSSIVVRSDNARGPALPPYNSALYYVVPLENLNGLLDYELRVARPEDGPSKLLARISGERVPIWQGPQPVISRDAKWLVLPLDDGQGTDLWVASTVMANFDGWIWKSDVHRAASFVVVGREVSICRRQRRCRYRTDGWAFEVTRAAWAAAFVP